MSKWEQIMNRLRKFMYGRYGFDLFSQTLIITSLVISLLGTMLGVGMLITISYIPFVFAVYRILSKNVSKRYEENYKVSQIFSSLKGKLNKSKKRLEGKKTHKYFKCPQCGLTIRVPKGKGKICITCQKCKSEFIKRT